MLIFFWKVMNSFQTVLAMNSMKYAALPPLPENKYNFFLNPHTIGSTVWVLELCEVYRKMLTESRSSRSSSSWSYSSSRKMFFTHAPCSSVGLRMDIFSFFFFSSFFSTPLTGVSLRYIKYHGEGGGHGVLC